MSTLSALTQFTSPDREKMQRPFVESGWTWASDGRMLVGWPEKIPGCYAQNWVSGMETFQVAIGIADTPAEKLIRMPVADLPEGLVKALADYEGRYQKHLNSECDECEGEGYITIQWRSKRGTLTKEFGEECPMCEGIGYTLPEPKAPETVAVRFGKWRFNAVEIWNRLACLPNAQIVPQPSEVGWLLGRWGDGLRGVFVGMPLRGGYQSRVVLDLDGEGGAR